MAKVSHAQLIKVSAFRWGKHDAFRVACGPRGKENVGQILVDNIDHGRHSRLAGRRISEDKRRGRNRLIGRFVDEENGCHRTFIMKGGASFS